MEDTKNMVERAARAMHAAFGSSVASLRTGKIPKWDDLDEIVRGRYRKAAHAAIAAIREPTEAMLDAGVRAAAGDDIKPTAGDMRAGFRAMIDAALAVELA